MYLCIYSLLIAVVLCVAAAQKARSCSSQCKSLKREHLKVETCRDAKKVLPRPKVGDFCSMANDQGFLDACNDLCAGKIPVSRLAQTCRAASQEMPRPTVRRWCEHGYQTSFAAAKRSLATQFVTETTTPTEPEVEAEPVTEPEAETTKRLVATIPITLDDKVVDLEMFEGDSAEDSVVAFCRTHLSDDIASCIRELLPTVLERLEAGTD